MAQTIKTWLREQSKNFKSKTIEELSSVYCFITLSLYYSIALSFYLHLYP